MTHADCLFPLSVLSVLSISRKCLFVATVVLYSIACATQILKTKLTISVQFTLLSTVILLGRTLLCCCFIWRIMHVYPRE